MTRRGRRKDHRRSTLWTEATAWVAAQGRAAQHVHILRDRIIIAPDDACRHCIMARALDSVR